MQELKIETRLGATIEVSEADFRECRDAGEKYFEEAIGVLSQTTTRAKLSKRILKDLQALKQRRRWWRYCFAGEDAGWERGIACVLHWGRGAVICPSCDDIYPAATLLMQAARLDGVERRFFCQNRHLLWETPEFVMGEIGGLEMNWHEPEAHPPWLPYPF